MEIKIKDNFTLGVSNILHFCSNRLILHIIGSLFLKSIPY